MKKRSKEGYVLIYVLVVLVLLSLLAAGACARAVGNYRAQSNSVERAKSLYAAEGVIEEAYAQLQDWSLTGEATGETEDAAKTAAETAAEEAIKEWADAKEATEALEAGRKYLVTLTAEDGGVTITAKLKVTLQVETTEHSNEDGTKTYTWTVSVTDLSYQLYEITESPTTP